jgi:hypothetical protein
MLFVIDASSPPRRFGESARRVDSRPRAAVTCGDAAANVNEPGTRQPGALATETCATLFLGRASLPGFVRGNLELDARWSRAALPQLEPQRRGGARPERFDVDDGARPLPVHEAELR